MPELPDLVYIESRLAPLMRGRRVVAVHVREPIVWRCLPGGSPAELLGDRTVQDLKRHGPFLHFTFDQELHLVVHPMLAGRFSLDPKRKAALCFTLEFADGILSYLDDKKMGKVYVGRDADLAKIPGFETQGVELLSAEFTRERFLDLLAKSRQQSRVFLMDQSKLSAIGNAYADEILFDAGIHPKTLCSQLNPEARHRLFDSIGTVLRRGIDAVASAGQELDVKVRDHMLVRNRKDEPCPRCGAKIRRASVLGYDSFFCPHCQPARRAGLVDWRDTRQ